MYNLYVPIEQVLLGLKGFWDFINVQETSS